MKQFWKRTTAIILMLTIAMNLLCVNVWAAEKDSESTDVETFSSYEYAWFPAPAMNLTQIAYESYSHGNCNAIDIAPGGNVFAPFTGTIVYKDARWGFVLLQSSNKVYYADGTLDYMTVGFMHDSDISNLYVGKAISQGTSFYQAGGMGNGNANAYAAHVDISVLKGKVNSVTSYGRGNVYAYNAFYINKSKTPVITNMGKMESGNTITNGGNSNWSTLWKYLPSGGGTTTPTGTQTVSDGEYHIVSALDNSKGLDVRGASKSDKTNIQLYANTNSAEQVFTVTCIGNGYYKIKNKYTNKVLDVDNAGKASGTNVQQYSDNGTAAQQWVIKDAGGGYFNIISKCNGLYLDVAGGNRSNGANIQVYNGNTTPSQKWKFIAWGGSTGKTISNGEYHIVSALDNSKGLDITDVSSKSGANVQLYANINNALETFQVTYLGNGYYKIASSYSKMCLDVYNGNVTSGTNVWQYYDNGSLAQQWIIKSAGNGYYYIISKGSGLYLDVHGGKANNRTNIQVYIGNKSNAQKWKFVSVAPSKTSLTSVKNAKGKKMTVKWKKNTSGTGYQIQYSTSSKFKDAKKVTVKKNSTTSATISKLTKGKTYYVRIRTYKSVSGKNYYSGWSGSKKVKISK